MPSFHRTTVMGNDTRDPELKHLQSGTAVCDISIAVNDRIKSGDDYKDVPTFYECVCWGRTAEIAAEYLRKGSPVLADGKMQTQTWEKDGQRRSKMVLKVESLQLLGGKPQRGEVTTQSGGDSIQEPPQDDDIPF